MSDSKETTLLAPPYDNAHEQTSSGDGYPADWNRVYEGGELVKAFPPVVDSGGNSWSGCSFYNCSGLKALHG